MFSCVIRSIIQYHLEKYLKFLNVPEIFDVFPFFYELYCVKMDRHATQIF